MSKCKYIIKGTLISIIITIIGIVLFSYLLVKTNLKEQYINIIIIIISSISILIGSSIATIKLNKNGILNGVLTALSYIIILYILSSIINKDFSMNLSVVYMSISGIVLGILGGIIGVNIKS